MLVCLGKQLSNGGWCRTENAGERTAGMVSLSRRKCKVYAPKFRDVRLGTVQFIVTGEEGRVCRY